MFNFILASFGLILMCIAFYMNVVSEQPKWLTIFTSAYTGFIYINWCYLLIELFY